MEAIPSVPAHSIPSTLQLPLTAKSNAISTQRSDYAKNASCETQESNQRQSMAYHRTHLALKIYVEIPRK